MKMWAKERREFLSGSGEETIQIGADFATTLATTSARTEVVGFFGDLGSGKTTFLKGMISELIGCDPHVVTSPTFNYLHLYHSHLSVSHFNLYRLPNGEEFERAGFANYLTEPGVCCIEWAEKIASLLPPHTIRITLQHAGDSKRLITIVAPPEGVVE